MLEIYNGWKENLDKIKENISNGQEITMKEMCQMAEIKEELMGDGTDILNSIIETNGWEISNGKVRNYISFLEDNINERIKLEELEEDIEIEVEV